MAQARVQIRDVAKHAGVSVGTVSNVLNGRASVAPHLVKQVQESMSSLGFVPNDAARQLSSGASRTLALLVLSNYNAFFNALADAAEDEAERRGHSVILGGSSQKPERENRYLDLFESQRVRGILLSPIDGVTSHVRRLKERGTPVVLLGAEDPEGEFCSVLSDAELGGYLAVRHLVDQGRRNILFVGGPLHQVQGRVDGAARAVAETDGVVMNYLSTDNLTIEEGRRVAGRILALPADERPDGIFAANDLLAIGLLHQLTQESTIQIPRELSIVGHDDIEFSASAVIPLTTIRQPVEQMAAAAVQLCLAEAESGAEHQHEVRGFSPELVVRHTSRATPLFH